MTADQLRSLAKRVNQTAIGDLSTEDRRTVSALFEAVADDLEKPLFDAKFLADCNLIGRGAEAVLAELTESPDQRLTEQALIIASGIASSRRA